MFNTSIRHQLINVLKPHEQLFMDGFERNHPTLFRYIYYLLELPFNFEVPRWITDYVSKEANCSLEDVKEILRLTRKKQGDKIEAQISFDREAISKHSASAFGRAQYEVEAEAERYRLVYNRVNEPSSETVHAKKEEQEVSDKTIAGTAVVGLTALRENECAAEAKTSEAATSSNSMASVREVVQKTLIEKVGAPSRMLVPMEALRAAGTTSRLNPQPSTENVVRTVVEDEILGSLDGNNASLPLRKRMRQGEESVNGPPAKRRTGTLGVLQNMQKIKDAIETVKNAIGVLDDEQLQGVSAFLGYDLEAIQRAIVSSENKENE